MDWIERKPLPALCQGCTDRLACLARSEGEWCCEECENLLERFTSAGGDGREGNEKSYI